MRTAWLDAGRIGAAHTADPRADLPIPAGRGD